MASYYDLPDHADRAREATRKVVADPAYGQFAELLVIYLGGHKDVMKLVIDGTTGRDYSSHTVLHRSLFDPKHPEAWEKQVDTVIEAVLRTPANELGGTSETQDLNKQDDESAPAF